MAATRVSEVSWNSLDSLVLGDDPGGFDFLEAPDQDGAAAAPLDPVSEAAEERSSYGNSILDDGYAWGGGDHKGLDLAGDTLEASFDRHLAASYQGDDHGLGVATTVVDSIGNGSLKGDHEPSPARSSDGDHDLQGPIYQNDHGSSPFTMTNAQGDHGSFSYDPSLPTKQGSSYHGDQLPATTTSSSNDSRYQGNQLPATTTSSSIYHHSPVTTSSYPGDQKGDQLPATTTSSSIYNHSPMRASSNHFSYQGDQLPATSTSTSSYHQSPMTASSYHGSFPGSNYQGDKPATNAASYYGEYTSSSPSTNTSSYERSSFSTTSGSSYQSETLSFQGEYSSLSMKQELYGHQDPAPTTKVIAPDSLSYPGSNLQQQHQQQHQQNQHQYQQHGQQYGQYQNYQGQRFPQQRQQQFGYQQSSFPKQQPDHSQGQFHGQIYQNSYQSQQNQAQHQTESFNYQTGNQGGYQYPEYPGWTYNPQTGQWEQTANYYGNQYGQGYGNFAANNGGISEYNSYSSSQYQQPAKFAATAPRTQEEAMRSTAGRPPCTVAAFGFGGKLVVMRPNQTPVQVFQMNQLVDFGLGYGQSNGPLAGYSSMKDVMKWIDERAVKAQESGLGSIRQMCGVLKICCQHYGNLRSTVNVAAMGRQDENGPEVALAKLLEPSKNEEPWGFGSRCLQATPTEQQLQATAFEVKRLLIAGKQKEALRAAQEGQLWGCALLMARQLGEKFYSDTIAEMAQRQFQPGFPLRTLTLLYAGQHAGVFIGNTNSSNVTQLQPQSVPAPAVDVATQDAVEGMLEEWQENLAIMAANRTNGDERVIMHLGDCLWRHRNEISGAHICYLVGNSSFEPYSSSSRLCLIGADHRKYPRTYASPEAIQRTEVYEFARVTGNAQFILLPFQPYKLIYASMLAEAGKINEALRYCQAVLKTLKTAGNTADVCKEAAVALEERLRIHSQGGPTSIVQRFFGNIGLHKVMAPSPPKPSNNADISSRPSTASSRSSVNLASSASMEPISDGTRKSNMPVRSISEPDFRPVQSDSPRTAANKGVFTSFVQKAIGLIRTPAKEAKLGDNNKFRYDETLKRWVEEGAEAQEPEPPLAPPPTTSFGSRVEFNRVEENGAPASIPPERPQSVPDRPQPTMSGIPPMPPSSNQYAARARQNVRSRYVDTFNKGGATTPPKPSSESTTPLFGMAHKASAKPSAPARFFVPAAAAAAAPESINHLPEPDPSSAAAFVPEMAHLPNGNGPFSAPPAAPPAAPPVVQDMRNDPGPIPMMPDHTSAPPAAFYSSYYPAAPAAASLPPPPALTPVAPPMAMMEKKHEVDDSSPVAAFAGDDLQDVEL